MNLLERADNGMLAIHVRDGHTDYTLHINDKLIRASVGAKYVPLANLMHRYPTLSPETKRAHLHDGIRTTYRTTGGNEASVAATISKITGLAIEHVTVAKPVAGPGNPPAAPKPPVQPPVQPPVDPKKPWNDFEVDKIMNDLKKSHDNAKYAMHKTLAITKAKKALMAMKGMDDETADGFIKSTVGVAPKPPVVVAPKPPVQPKVEPKVEPKGAGNVDNDLMAVIQDIARKSENINPLDISSRRELVKSGITRLMAVGRPGDAARKLAYSIAWEDAPKDLETDDYINPDVASQVYLTKQLYQMSKNNGEDSELMGIAMDGVDALVDQGMEKSAAVRLLYPHLKREIPQQHKRAKPGDMTAPDFMTCSHKAIDTYFQAVYGVRVLGGTDVLSTAWRAQGKMLDVTNNKFYKDNWRKTVAKMDETFKELPSYIHDRMRKNKVSIAPLVCGPKTYGLCYSSQRIMGMNIEGLQHSPSRNWSTSSREAYVNDSSVREAKAQRATIIHELAHALHGAYDKTWSDTTRAFEKFQAAMRTKRWVQESWTEMNISVYAKTNLQEFAAESFAKYHLDKINKTGQIAGREAYLPEWIEFVENLGK